MRPSPSPGDTEKEEQYLNRVGRGGISPEFSIKFYHPPPPQQPTDRAVAAFSVAKCKFGQFVGATHQPLCRRLQIDFIDIIK